MKNKFLLKRLFLALTLTTISVIYAEPIPAATLKKAVNLTEVDETTGCSLLGNAGGLINALDASGKARACVVCGDKWAKDSKALPIACGTSGDLSGKQKDILSKALAEAVSSPDRSCENLGQLYKRFDLFTKEQRVQAAVTCFSKWPKYPKAQKAVIKPEDFDESKQIIGDIPSWDEVAQAQAFAKVDPKGDLKTEITKEQYDTVTKKK